MPDEVLVHAIAARDVRAFETLYGRFWHPLLTYLIGQLGDRALAEDVLQDVMLAVWHGAEHFRGEASVRTWLFVIARRQAIQARHRSRRVLDPLDETIPGEHPLPSDIVEQRDRRDDVRAALEKLPSQQREVIELIFYHGMTGPEVANVTGVALGTVKSRLRNAKTLLMRLLRLQETSDA